MGSQADAVDADSGADDERNVPTISAHETVPGRLVFTETGNEDGWIATELTVDVVDCL